MAMAGSQPQRRNSPTQGAAMLALSALFFALMGGLIREASSTVNNETVVFFRNLVGVLFFLPLALTRGIGPLRTRRPLSHLLRTTYGLGGMYCYFYALAHLPLTDAMLFSYAAPVFTPIAYMAIVFAGVIAWLRWDELPSHTSLLGAALIFAASLIPLLGNRPAERPR